MPESEQNPAKQGNTYLVTGASSGIGLAVSHKLINAGHAVVGMARRVDDMAIKSARFSAIACDLLDFDQTEQRVKTLLKTDVTLAGAVFCAGAGYFGALEQLSFSKIQALMNINLLSPMQISKLIVPQLKNQNAGRLIYIGSEAALNGAKNGTAYCASKFGLRGFTQALSAECAQANVAVSLLNPGVVNTPFFDDLHFAPGKDSSNYIDADDIADLVLQIIQTRTDTLIDEINLSPRNKVIDFK